MAFCRTGAGVAVACVARQQVRPCFVAVEPVGLALKLGRIAAARRTVADFAAARMAAASAALLAKLAGVAQHYLILPLAAFDTAAAFEARAFRSAADRLEDRKGYLDS